MVALAVINMALTLGFAWNLSSFVASMFAGHGLSLSMPALNAFVGFGLARALTAWLQEWLGGFSAAAAKSELRNRTLDAVVALGPEWVATRGTGNLHALLTQQLDALDAYFAKFLPQLVYTALITPVFTVVIFTTDPISGWSLLLTLPLVPLFMLLIGWATQNVQQKQMLALGALTGHFVDALRGLTTLRVFGRAEHQVDAIAVSANQYRERTMKVLRISFLSGFALELIASLSVALIAVSIGLRLVNGNLTLLTGLFVLLLAPEAYLPLRIVGALFHTSAEGVAAAGQVLDIIDEAGGKGGSANAPKAASSSVPALAFERSQLTVVHGPSGAGKTTALNRLRAMLDPATTVWLPQRVGLMDGTVEQNIVGFHGQPVNQEALTKSFALAAIDDLLASQPVGQDAKLLSGGQAQRVGLARAFYAALNLPANTSATLLLDEPISAQDSKRAAHIGGALLELTKLGHSVVTVSHQPISGAHATIAVEVAQ